MKRMHLCLCALLLILIMAGCRSPDASRCPTGAVDATKHGLSADHSATENSLCLQRLIDQLSAEQGGTIYLPSGEYEFAQTGTQTYGSHCIKMRSNVSIVGDGATTILKPIGTSDYGLDMFYFNEYLDTHQAVYLENCRFENFVIDGSGTSCRTYTSAGKGFMFNLFRNCHWKNVTVQYTDATGFGVDCPIDSSLTDCTAIGCGKAATTQDPGASGFGIGFGYCDNESILMTGCLSQGNRKFGFLIEHQGRFDPLRYPATDTGTFLVSDCFAEQNLYNYGGIIATNTIFRECISSAAARYGFLFENSSRSSAEKCYSVGEAEAALVILQSPTKANACEVTSIVFSQCYCTNTPVGARVIGLGSSAPMLDNGIRNCRFEEVLCPIYTEGEMQGLDLSGNVSDIGQNQLEAYIECLLNAGNSWNFAASEP